MAYTKSNSAFAQDQDMRAMIIKDPSKSYIDYLALINRFDLPDGFAYLDGLRGYLFMSRPDLNLFENGVLNEQASTKLSFNEFAGSKRQPDSIHLAIAKMLQRNTGYPSSFIIPITNRAKGYTPNDQILETLDIGETFYGSKVRYGRHTGQSRGTGSFTLTFEDDKYLTLYKLIALWIEYIDMVYYGDMKPTDTNIRQNILDYAGSFFFLAVRMTAEPVPVSSTSTEKKNGYEIVYWEKLTGVFPSTRNDSAFAYTKGQPISPEFSVQFEYSMKSKSGILDPYVLSEFNEMNRWQHNASKTSFPTTISKKSADGSGRIVREPGMAFVNAPSVFRANGKFYLEWV